MIQNFIFKETTMLKSQLYKFICDTLEANGWTKLSKGRIADNEVYASKGVSGKDNILFQMQPYYSSSKNDTLSDTTANYIGIRPLHTYTPNANLTSVGVALPAREMQWFYVFSTSIAPESKIRVAYHCNADRMMMIITTPEVISGKSSIFVVGKLNYYAETNEYSQTTTFISPSYRYAGARTASLANYNHSASYDLSMYHSFSTTVPKPITPNGTRHSAEFALWSAEMGLYAKIDNIILLPNTIFSVTNQDIYKDSLKDSNGYTWRLCAANTSYNSVPYSYFAYRIG